MIIVEGCDNSGKTTLVAKLAQDLQLLSINNRKRPQSLEEVNYYTLHMVQLSMYHSTIFDRWQPISEPIYGPVCRGIDLIDSNSLARLLAITQEAKPLVIYCRPSLSTILNFGDRGQMEGVVQHGAELVSCYDSAMKTIAGILPVVKYDYEAHTYDEILNQARTHLNGPIQ